MDQSFGEDLNEDFRSYLKRKKSSVSYYPKILIQNVSNATTVLKRRNILGDRNQHSFVFIKFLHRLEP